MLSRLVLALLIVGFSTNSYAKRFSSQYCEFELPSGWNCALEGTEWVCQAINKDRKKEAIIILAAKIRGNQDSLPMYQAYLKKTKTFNLPGGKTQVSDAKYANIKEINGHRWVDSLHMASEVPGFYTRYLATVKEDLGVAVTFSVGKDFYQSYQALFDKIVATLRVFRQKNMDTSKFKLARKDEDILDKTVVIPDGGEFAGGIGKRQKGRAGKAGGASDYLIYLVIAGAVGFFLMKARKKKPAGKKKKKSKKS